MSVDVDFNKIILSKSDQKALSVLKKNKLVTLESDVAEYLLKCNLISLNYVVTDSYGEPVYDGRCYLNENGKKYLLYRSNKNMSKFWDWFRYLLTALIALTALVLSIISLYLQNVQP